MLNPIVLHLSIIVNVLDTSFLGKIGLPHPIHLKRTEKQFENQTVSIQDDPVMNVALLKSAEAQFLKRYPGGFQHPEMKAISKKHQLEKRVTQAREWFAYDRFVENDGVTVTDAMIKLVSASSLISVFEKPKFRDTVKTLSKEERQALADALHNRLYGDAKEGFEEMTAILSPHQIAKWPILTVIPAYLQPEREAFVKPTTAKGILSHFAVENLKYSPKPSWGFYAGFRDFIVELKSRVDPCLTGSNAAFCGFLMMTIAWGQDQD